jgi:hypothetical protein
VGDRWEFFYGGDVPVRDGALGNLTVNTHQITDKDLLQRLQKPAVVKVLPEGTPLLVALSSDCGGGGLFDEVWHLINHKDLPASATWMEMVRLGPPKPNVSRIKFGEGVAEDQTGGLWLKVKGFDKTELISSTILMPEGFDEPTAISLNHAFTMLSERFETLRLSHTGSAYTRVFYKEANGRWYPLADLREGVLVSAERQLIADSWRKLEALLGWRPVVRPSKKKKG